MDSDLVDEAEVTRLARSFRGALEETVSLRLPGLAKFPRAACGDASRLLAQYLRDRGLGDWEIVSGFRNDRSSSHAWLELGGLLVDITADQFEDGAEPVTVSRSSDWHAAWPDRSRSRCRVGLSYYDPASGARDDYERLVEAARRLTAPPAATSAAGPPAAVAGRGFRDA